MAFFKSQARWTSPSVQNEALVGSGVASETPPAPFWVLLFSTVAPPLSLPATLFTPSLLPAMGDRALPSSFPHPSQTIKMQ